jgi:hypothetical protein
MFRFQIATGLLSLIFFLSGCQQESPPIHKPQATGTGESEAPTPDDSVVTRPAETETKPVESDAVARALFDGKTLDGWTVSKFGGDGSVSVVNGEIDIESGRPLTGISWTGKEIPRDNFRVSLESKRTAGIDFFCCLTFPVHDSHCSLVVAGWSGTVVGLSSIDGQDASNNDTTSLIAFDDNRWYKIEVEVGGDSVRAFIDGKQILEQQIEGHVFDVRNEVRLSRPLGICTFETDARIRNITIEPIPSGESDNQ